MYDSQTVVERIRNISKRKDIPIGLLNEKCEISENTISQSGKSEYGMKAKNLYMIAEFLDVSVDYLLGRTDKPTPTFTNVGNNNNGNQAIHGNVTVSQPQETDNRDLQLLQMIQELSPIDYARVVLFIDEMKNKGT